MGSVNDYMDERARDEAANEAKRRARDAEAFRKGRRWFLLVAGTVTFLSCAAAGGCPLYNVWQQGKAGESELRRAEQNRQVAVQEALAKKESAVLLADAEVSRAEGAAKANKILGESLKNNEVYLWYLWIQALEQTKDQVIYVPTEANLPILEAGRLHKIEAPQPGSGK